MSGPTTEAGQRLLRKPWYDTAKDGDLGRRILAIEAEARAAERARIREAVEGLPVSEPCGGWGCPGGYDDRAAVLALTEPDPA